MTNASVFVVFVFAVLFWNELTANTEGLLYIKLGLTESPVGLQTLQRRKLTVVPQLLSEPASDHKGKIKVILRSSVQYQTQDA